MTNKQPFSRRSLLKGLGVSALGAGIGVSVPGMARAQAAASASELPLALERLKLGDMGVTLFKEASLQLQPAMFGAGAPEGAVSELLGEYNLPSDVVNASANLVLLDMAGDLTLVDTGTGSNLLGTLEALGVAPGDVKNVVLTHWHGDHVGGVSVDGALQMPNATHYFPQLDWDFLQSADNENAQGSLAKLQPAQDAGVLELYDDEELFAGVQAIAAPGHTPGHHVVMLGGDTPVMHMADTANHFLVALMHPEWSFAFDADPAQATATRVEMYGRAADEGLNILAYHFPFPGTGVVVREGEAFRFLPSLPG